MSSLLGLLERRGRKIGYRCSLCRGSGSREDG
nr:MAG TPA: hypothetical protein [Caudoviricetes sp.]